MYLKVGTVLKTRKQRKQKAKVMILMQYLYLWFSNRLKVIWKYHSHCLRGAVVKTKPAVECKQQDLDPQHMQEFKLKPLGKN